MDDYPVESCAISPTAFLFKDLIQMDDYPADRYAISPMAFLLTLVEAFSDSGSILNPLVSKYQGWYLIQCRHFQTRSKTLGRFFSRRLFNLMQHYRAALRSIKLLLTLGRFETTRGI